MRLARVSHPAGPTYGIVADDVIRLLDSFPFDPSEPRETGETITLADATLLTPVETPTIYAIGRNYADHAREMGFELPSEPSVFMKPRASLLAHGGTVVLPPPRLSTEVQHEAELAVIIGISARDVSVASALDYVYGYTCANDVSARDIQRSDLHITRAKGFDTFCPLGPWIETDLDASAVPVRCSVNGELRQDGNSKDLIFDVPSLVSYISEWATLEPGDVILTGSPAGTGSLLAGDMVEIEIGGIGTLVHYVIDRES